MSKCNEGGERGWKCVHGVHRTFDLPWQKGRGERRIRHGGEGSGRGPHWSGMRIVEVGLVRINGCCPIAQWVCTCEGVICGRTSYTLGVSGSRLALAGYLHGCLVMYRCFRMWMVSVVLHLPHKADDSATSRAGACDDLFTC